MKPWGTVGPKYGIAIPMICFCDIPLMKTIKHRGLYGNYCIGIDKEKAKELLPLNPVFYVSSDWISHTIEDLVDCTPTEKTIKSQKIENQDVKLSDVLARASAMIKEQQAGNMSTSNYKLIPAISTLLSVVKTDISCYDEREWRIFYSKNGQMEFGLTKNQFDENQQIYQDRLKTCYVTLDSDIIKQIIVPKEQMIPRVINRIHKLKTILGKPVTEDDKLLLISKISSFERIDGDY